VVGLLLFFEYTLKLAAISKSATINFENWPKRAFLTSRGMENMSQPADPAQMPSMVSNSRRIPKRRLVFREELFSATILKVCTMECLVVERPWFGLRWQEQTEASILRDPQKALGDLE
jgi:hypothetical protein